MPSAAGQPVEDLPAFQTDKQPFLAGRFLRGRHQELSGVSVVQADHMSPLCSKTGALGEDPLSHSFFPVPSLLLQTTPRSPALHQSCPCPAAGRPRRAAREKLVLNKDKVVPGCKRGAASSPALGTEPPSRVPAGPATGKAAAVLAHRAAARARCHAGAEPGNSLPSSQNVEENQNAPSRTACVPQRAPGAGPLPVVLTGHGLAAKLINIRGDPARVPSRLPGQLTAQLGLAAATVTRGARRHGVHFSGSSISRFVGSV